MIDYWLALRDESVIIPVVGTTHQHNKGIVMLPTIALDLDGTLNKSWAYLNKTLLTIFISNSDINSTIVRSVNVLYLSNN